MNSVREAVFIGSFGANDKMHGHGIFTWSSGNRYEGELANDKMHGQGTITLANGKKTEGTHVEGKLEGKR